MLCQRRCEGEVQEGWIEFGTLGEGYLALYAARVDECSAKSEIRFGFRLGFPHSLVGKRLYVAYLGAGQIVIRMLMIVEHQVECAMRNG